MADSRKVIEVYVLYGLGNVLECAQAERNWIVSDGANSIIKEQN
jgi:hypothetical protein